MKPAERDNLIAVKTELAAKYVRKANAAGSDAKRRHYEVKSRMYTRQAATLKAQHAAAE